MSGKNLAIPLLICPTLDAQLAAQFTGLTPGVDRGYAPNQHQAFTVDTGGQPITDTAK